MVEIESSLTQVLLELAHHPYLLICGIILILFASSFGLPLPEEVVLITSGMIASASLQEAQRLGTDPTINPWLLAAVCFFAVVMSDLLVFALGRKYGLALLRKKPFNRFLTENALTRVQSWTERYGAIACGIFRFTPGVRFPGHFMCGALKLSYRQFFLTDGVAALLTVPTQVIFVAFYGQTFLNLAKQFKLGLLGVVAVGLVVWLAIKLRSKYSKSAKSVRSAGDSADPAA